MIAKIKQVIAAIFEGIKETQRYKASHIGRW